MTSSEYWRRREAAQREKNIRDEAEYAKELRRIYEDMMDGVQKEIDAFYARYAAKEGITLAAAKRRADKLDLEAYERKAEKYVREKNFSKQANDEMRLYNLVMKVNRLELLKANIGLELVGGFDEMQKFFDEKLTDRTLSEFRRQAGILGKSVQNNAAMAHAIVNASFHNATFSDRIWMHQDILKGELAKQLQIGLIQGKGSRELARNIRKQFDVSRTDAERLMTTELRRVQTGAAKLSYQTNGNEEYTFLALNPEVNSVICDECRKLDGTHHKVKDMQPGENAPPMHPRCHCATAPYWDEEEFQRWLDSLGKGGTTEDWEKKKDAENQFYRKSADPLKRAFGSIKYSHPEEIKRIKRTAKRLGVEMIEGGRAMAYAPGLARGCPGQLHISENDSYGAWLHEEQHMLDDAADGWAGFEGLVDVDRRCKMEYNSYKKEIDLAKSIGRDDLADELKTLYTEEIKQIGGEPVDIE